MEVAVRDNKGIKASTRAANVEIIHLDEVLNVIPQHRQNLSIW